jgi:hypothetical protein
LLFFSGRAAAADRVVVLEGFWTLPEEQRRAVAAMEKGPMPLAVIETGPDTSGDGDFTRSFPLLKEYLLEHHRFIGTTDFGASTGLLFDVWVQRDRALAGTYQAFSLPCFR